MAHSQQAPRSQQTPQGARQGESLQTPRSQKSATGEPETLFHSVTLYDGTQGRNVLCPGQVLPLWRDGARAMDNVEIHGYFAIRKEDKLITAEGYCPTEEEVQNLIDSPDADASSRRQYAALEHVALGNAGGRRVLRPDYAPIGLLPMQTRYAEAFRPQVSFNQMGVMQWGRAFLHANHVQETPPRIRFFVRGTHERAFDPTTGGWLSLDEVLLPFSWYSPFELGLVGGEKGAEDRFFLRLNAGITRMGLHKGEVFMGTCGEEHDAPMSLEEYQTSGFDNPVWVLPYNDEMPLIEAGDRQIYQTVGAVTGKTAGWETGRIEPIAAPSTSIGRKTTF